MKRTIISLLGIILFMSAYQPSYAGDYGEDYYGFNWCIKARTQNYYSSILAIPILYLNAGLAYLTQGDYDEDMWIPYDVPIYNIFKVRKGGEKLDVNDGRMYGYKAKDMFSHIETGLRFGWQWSETPIGIFGELNYRFRRFSLEWEEGTGETKYKIHSFEPGIGARVSPLFLLYRNYEWCPIVEVATYYVNNFRLSGGFNGESKEINNGWRYSYGVGATFGDDDQSLSLLVGLEVDDFDLFNQDYSYGSSIPYKDVTTFSRRIFLKVNLNF